MIGLDHSAIDANAFVEVFSGNQVLPGMDPHATCYGGHQFGNWAGQLGDGRAINLGEINVGDAHYMLQLKGAGPTPFSRSADGLGDRDCARRLDRREVPGEGSAPSPPCQFLAPTARRAVAG